MFDTVIVVCSVVAITSTWNALIIRILFKHEKRLTILENKIEKLCNELHTKDEGND